MEDSSEYNTPGGKGIVFDTDKAARKQHIEMTLRYLFHVFVAGRYADPGQFDFSVNTIRRPERDTVAAKYSDDLPLQHGCMTAATETKTNQQEYQQPLLQVTVRRN